MSRYLACLGLVLAIGAPAWAKSEASPRAATARPSALPQHLVAPARIAVAYGVITSGFRSVAHNRSVGGVPNSHHLYGRALDVARRPGVSHRMIEDALRRAGFRLVESLDEGDHSHFAFAAPGTSMPLTLATAPRPKASLPPPPPRLLADNHGTLLAASPLPAGPEARPGVLATRAD